MAKLKKGKRGSEHIRKQEIMPSEALECFLKILKDHGGKSFFREDLSERIIWHNPYWAQFFFTKKVPFGSMANPELLGKILNGFGIVKKRNLLNNALTDVSHMRYCNLSKITGMKRRLVRRGERITSNTETGIGDLDTASKETVARGLYHILNWNRGQLNTWHDHVERFNKQSKSKVAIEKLNEHSRKAYNHGDLNGLANIMGLEANIK